MALLALMMASSVFTVGRTNAGFSDVETSEDNIWVAGSLDMEVTYAERFSVVGMNPKQSPDGRITVTNVGSLDYRYDVKFVKTSGDDLLCQNLHLVAKRDGSTEYEGALASFNLLGGLYTQTSFQETNWDFVLTLPTEAGSELENLSCQWSVDFEAWQTNLPTAAQGFHDEESIAPNSVATGEWLTAGDVIINEVMWMGSSVSSHDEWIELKNLTGKAVSLAGWHIENAGMSGATLTIPSGKSIPAHGYFLIANYDKNDVNSALNTGATSSSGQWITTSLSLNNSNNGNLVLRAPSTTVVIDQALGATDWPAGNSGSLYQSMERNDVLGDGLLASSWHTCVSGAANGAPYWDVTGPNFGTPLAANLSPIVMNEFVPNPVGDDAAPLPDGEWIELYNILEEDIDVANWYFTNSDGDTIGITSQRTNTGDTIVPGQGTLVVYLEEAFLDNNADTLSLYDPRDLLETTDDVREDVVSYHDANIFAEGKSFARFPDGEGIWLDPEATPGTENVLAPEEAQLFQWLAYDACFEGEDRLDDATDPMCSPLFLKFIGMIDDLEDKTIRGTVFLDLLETIEREESAKLMALLLEDGVITPEEAVLGDLTTSDTSESVTQDGESTDETSKEEGDQPVKEATVPESVSAEVIEPVTTTEATPEDVAPTDEAVKEEEDIDIPETKPIPEVPDDDVLTQGEVTLMP